MCKAVICSHWYDRLFPTNYTISTMNYKSFVHNLYPIWLELPNKNILVNTNEYIQNFIIEKSVNLVFIFHSFSVIPRSWPNLFQIKKECDFIITKSTKVPSLSPNHNIPWHWSSFWIFNPIQWYTHPLVQSSVQGLFRLVLEVSTPTLHLLPNGAISHLSLCDRALYI